MTPLAILFAFIFLPFCLALLAVGIRSLFSKRDDNFEPPTIDPHIAASRPRN